MSKYKFDILGFLLKNRETFVSGQHIAEQLDISRTAVWKTIESLKQEGFVIESIQNKGYQLRHFPNVWDESLMKLMVQDNDYFKAIHVFKEVDSTQKRAHQILIDEKEPFIVISEVQTSGRGRFNRPWDSQGENGLWMSLVFDPHVSFKKIATFNLFISLAIAKTINEYADVDARIKWPNDIYIDSGKVCGFLTEINGDAEGVKHIICGIGINLNHDLEHFPEELHQKASSLKIKSGIRIDRYKFFMMLIANISTYYQKFLEMPFSSIKDEYKERSNIWGRELIYTENKKQVKGTAIDIKDDGTLVVMDDDGALHQFISADIEMQVE